MRLLTILTLLMMLAAPLSAQVEEELKLKLERSVYIREATQGSPEQPPYLLFPHLNEIDYFDGKKIRKAIIKAEEEQDYYRLDTLLSYYVSHFTPRNFREDIDMVWKAGQVKEILGDTTAAMLYYEIGIKNQRPYHPKVRIHYDSLIQKTQVNWVELNFYYKLLEARRKVDPLIPPKGVMLNMGPKVNSDRADYAPFMHPSDSILIFTSRRDEEIVIDDISPRKNEDLFISQRDWISGNWTYSEKFSKSINSEWNEGSSCLDPAGKTLIFTRCDAPEGMGSCDIYAAEYAGDDWVNIRNLGPNVNSAYWDSHPNLSPDGKMLFFTSDRTGGFGKSDLFVCHLQDDGTWGKAQNLGPTINTMEDEVTPFYHKVNNTLYFSSTGHLLNMGGYDIFKSRFFEDHWEPPNNVGPLVNSKSNEYYFSIDGKGTRLFYAKSKEGEAASAEDQLKQNYDLYSFPMPMEARPDAIYRLKGYLIDSVSGYPITGVVLVIDKDEGVEVAPKFINKFGYFEFDLMNNKNYDIYIQGENFLTINDEIVMTGDTTFTEIVKSFEAGKPLVFQSLEFDENSWDLAEAIEPKLNYIARFLQRYPMFNLEVNGHTDSEGEAEYNLDLSRKRAAQIRKYIIERAGIPDNRVVARGYGESRPLVPNNTTENRQINRRVEFEVWIDPDYKGDVALPTENEFMLEEEMDDILDPEFMKEETFDFDWEEELDLEWEEDDDADLLKEYDNFGLDEIPSDEEETPDDTDADGDGTD